MDLKWLKYFHEVAQARSFTLAARQLKISQPAVSKMISLFEAELGVRLFLREGKRVSLSEAGRAFFERTQVIFDEQENLERLRNLYHQECVGDLALGASDNLLSYVFPPFVGSFLKKRVYVNLKIFSGASPELKRELLERRIELAFFFTPLTGEEKKILASEVIWEVEFALVMKRDLYPLRKKEHYVFSAPEFNARGLRYLGSRTSDYSDNNPALKLHYEHLGIEAKSFVQVNNHEVIKRLCLEGIGYTVIPRYMVADALRSGELIEVKTREPMISKVFLVRRKTAILSRPAREFLKELRSGLTEMQPKQRLR